MLGLGCCCWDMGVGCRESRTSNREMRVCAIISLRLTVSEVLLVSQNSRQQRTGTSQTQFTDSSLSQTRDHTERRRPPAPKEVAKVLPQARPVHSTPN